MQILRRTKNERRHGYIVGGGERQRQGFFALGVLALAFSGCSPDRDITTSATIPPETEAFESDDVADHRLADDDGAGARVTNDDVTQTLEELTAQRAELDQEVWADEVIAQQYEQFFVQLWDDLRSAPDPWNVLMSVPVSEVAVPMLVGDRPLELGIRELLHDGRPVARASHELVDVAERLRSDGFQLLETEWHHSTFTRTAEQTTSQVSFVLHLGRRLAPGRPSTNTAESKLPDDTPQQRLIVRGVLDIEWSAGPLEPQIGRAVVRDVKILTRTGLPAFRHVLTYTRRPNEFASAHPILVYDLDRNGYPEILISRWNRVYWNQGPGRFREAPLFDHFVPLTECGVIADVSHDGIPDFVGVDKRGSLIVYPGDEDGHFSAAPQIHENVRVPGALAITAGDADGDQDLDLYVTQYKPSYLGGQMPTPYYDANDGEPAFLLINDGDGHFRDGTIEAGLAAKRNRRTYSASFIDFDDDQDQDLMVVSDYAGVDLYENAGDGTFSDVSATLLPEQHLFGMAHTFADFDGDGQTDIYAIGMSSTTARRLDRMGLGRQDMPEVHQMRAAMGYGNRMYLRRDGQFVSPDFAADVARTGWSWGTTSFDFDLDGDRDIYVANGFRSGESCQDYCTTFWRHDIYTGNSAQSDALRALFATTMKELDRGRISWNGFEHNSLLLSLDRQRFENVAFLLGVGFEFDARAVVSADFDSDGRPDLAVAEYDFVGQGFELSLHVFQNVLQTEHHWIGVDLHSHDPARQPIGTVVRVRSAQGQQIGRVVTGDSFLSQHSARLHFGLGNDDHVEQVEIRWPNGAVERFDDWQTDEYHRAVTAD